MTEKIATDCARAETQKAEDFGFRRVQTIYQGDTSHYFRESINE